MIPLTEEQARAQQDQKSPLKVLNPHTREVYVLVREDVYELTRTIVGGGKGQAWDDDADEGLIQKRP
jgi:hypothetical protein